MAARLKKHPTSEWLAHYLPDDRYKIAGGIWKYVSTDLDTYYHRPDSPLMMSQPAGRVIGFASAAEAEEAGYRPDPSARGMSTTALNNSSSKVWTISASEANYLQNIREYGGIMENVRQYTLNNSSTPLNVVTIRFKQLLTKINRTPVPKRFKKVDFYLKSSLQHIIHSAIMTDQGDGARGLTVLDSAFDALLKSIKEAQKVVGPENVARSVL